MPVRIPVAVLALVLGSTVALVVLTTAARPHEDAAGAERVAQQSRPAAHRATEALALRVLHDWDARRARAWAAGDTAAVLRLYVPGSAAGRADARLLRRYRARGLVVRDLRMQVLRARVLVARPGRLELEVTDRLAAATAVRTGAPDTGHRLPGDRAATHELVLRRLAGTWLIASVSDPRRSRGR